MFGENFGRAPCDWCPFPILSMRPNVPPEEYSISKYGGAGETKLMVKYSFSMNKYRRYKCIVERSPKFIGE